MVSVPHRTRKDFRSFLNAMERRGRDEVDVIARETSNETGKTEEEVRRYHTVFWARHKELADWERVIDKIEKGEKRLQRSKEIREALAEKIARSPKPHECLGRAFSVVQDVFALNEISVDTDYGGYSSCTALGSKSFVKFIA